MRIGTARRSVPELFAGFWFTTTAFLLLGPLSMAVLVTVDTLAGEAGVFPRLFISPTAAQTILGTIAGSLVTVAALTSSLTVVTLQLLSTQFTPRALRGFLRSRLSQAVLGSLIGIFLYCLLVAVTVRDPGTYNRPFVPSLSVVVSIGLALVGLVLLVVFIHHLVTSIQVSNLTAVIARQTRAALATTRDSTTRAAADEFPGEFAEEFAAALDDAGTAAGSTVRVLDANRPGYVRALDLAMAGRAVAGLGACVRFTVAPGDFVSRGEPILTYCAAQVPSAAVLAALRHAVPITAERDITADPGFGVRQLTDIALRAIAPGVNDPSTAVTCIGYLRDLLVDAAAVIAPARVGLRCGSSTVLADCTSFAVYVAPFVEIGRYARDARVAAALLDALHAAARTARTGPAEDHLDVLVVAADAVAGQAITDARTDLDRARLTSAHARIQELARRRAPEDGATAAGPPLAAQPELADALVRAAQVRTRRTQPGPIGTGR